MAEISVLLAENPIILWGGLVLGIIIFIATRYLENRGDEEFNRPRPSTLDALVKPRIKEQLEMRGKNPEKSMFKIGREVQGQVQEFVDTKMPKELMNPNPNKKGGGLDVENLTEDDFENVRVLKIGSHNKLSKFLQELKFALANTDEEDEVDRWQIYIFRKDSFLDVPGDDMVLDPDVLSYNYAGMEVEIDNAARNMIHSAVSTEVSEKVLAALPNYTDKVDYLFPHHSQEMSRIEQEGENMGGDGFS